MSAGSAPALNEVVGAGGAGRRAAVILPRGVEEAVMIVAGGEDSERKAGKRRGLEGEPGCAKALSVAEASTSGVGGVSAPGESSGEEAVSLEGEAMLGSASGR